MDNLGPPRIDDADSSSTQTPEAQHPNDHSNSSSSHMHGMRGALAAARMSVAAVNRARSHIVSPLMGHMIGGNRGRRMSAAAGKDDVGSFGGPGGLSPLPMPPPLLGDASPSGGPNSVVSPLALDNSGRVLDSVQQDILSSPVPSSQVTAADAERAAADAQRAATDAQRAASTSTPTTDEDDYDIRDPHSVRCLVNPDGTCPPVKGPNESSLCEFRDNLLRLQNGCEFTPGLVAQKSSIGQHDVFANADLALSRITQFGFDFDFTLASYNDNVQVAIYKYAQQYLVERMGYPSEVLERKFDRTFAIRGLHFDTATGFILKIDQFGKVSTGCVYLGRQKAAISDIVDAYKGVSITAEYREKNLHQLADLFALSETTLLADIIQTFVDKKLAYSPDYIARDVRAAIEYVHVSGQLHGGIMDNPEYFLERSPLLGEYLLRLRDAGKLTFLLTNSPFAFVDVGMRFMLEGIEQTAAGRKHKLTSSADWTQLFDVCITSARKPAFYTRQGHFRRVDPHNAGRLSWQPVERFERGAVYTEGSLAEFTRLVSLGMQDRHAAKQAAATEAALKAGTAPPALSSIPALRGHQVLYMGDHVAADLTAPWQSARWRTAAIVREIAHETAVQSSPAFKEQITALLRVEALIDYGQRIHTDETRRALRDLKKQRQDIKQRLLTLFNPHFGSVFRTTSHRTEFFNDVGRFADIYTSSVTNLLNYSLSHTFYTSRNFFPHEVHYTINP